MLFNRDYDMSNKLGYSVKEEISLPVLVFVMELFLSRRYKNSDLFYVSSFHWYGKLEANKMATIQKTG